MEWTLDRPETDANGSRRPRVVIAEDYVLIQENIRKAIERDCDIVASVEDGEAALEAVVAHAPDILLLDISLPGVNGFAIAQKLKAMQARVKVIFVTAHGDRAYVERAFELGAAGYVLKGKMWTDLPAAIRAVAGGGSYRSPLIQ
jgi:two-component system, NarL family, nitrate/nitrite response regulator NarL